MTTDPTIIKAEGRIDFDNHVRRIRDIIDPNRTPQKIERQPVTAPSQHAPDDAHAGDPSEGIGASLGWPSENDR